MHERKLYFTFVVVAFIFSLKNRFEKQPTGYTYTTISQKLFSTCRNQSYHLNHTNSLTTHTKMYKQRQPTVNNIDVQLIREFALRPIIYNKATPYFKNKYLTDSAWDEIASKVGGDGESYPFN